MSIFDSLDQQYILQSDQPKNIIITSVKDFIDKENKRKWYSKIFTVTISCVFEEETLFILYYPILTNNYRGCAIVSVNFIQEEEGTEITACIQLVPKWVRKDYLVVLIVMMFCASVLLFDPSIKMYLLFLGFLVFFNGLLISNLIFIRYRLKGYFMKLLKHIGIYEKPILFRKDLL